MAKQLWTPDHTYMNLLDPIPKPWGLLWNWSSFLSGLSTRSGNLHLFSFKGIVVALEHLQQHIQVLRYILFALTVRKSFWGLSPFFLVQAVVLKMQRLESIYTRSCVEPRFKSLYRYPLQLERQGAHIPPPGCFEVLFRARRALLPTKRDALK